MPVIQTTERKTEKYKFSEMSKIACCSICFRLSCFVTFNFGMLSYDPHFLKLKYEMNVIVLFQYGLYGDILFMVE